MSTEASVRDAILLIENAAQRGLDLKPDVAKPVIDFEAALAAGAPTPDLAAKFWQAYAMVAGLVRPVTVASLKAAMSETRSRGVWKLKWTVQLPSPADRAVRRYRRMAVIALLCLSVTQIYWLVGSTVVADIEKLPKAIEDAREAILKRGLELATPTAGGDRLVRGAGQTAQGRDRVVPAAVAAEDLQIGRLEAEIAGHEVKLEMSYRVLEGWNRGWQGALAGLYRLWQCVGPQVLSPRSAAPVLAVTSRGGVAPEPASSQQSASGAQARTRLETPRARSGFPAEDFRQQRVLAETKAKFALQAMQLYLLPFVYGFLGTCVFILRNLSAEAKASSYSSEVGYRLRLPLGALAGVAIAWFINPESNVAAFKSVPPLALAFLAGYSVEVLFSAMDRFITAFSSDGGPSVQRGS